MRRGRPKADTVKQQVTLRLDPEIIESFKADGPGWQTRLNKALKVYLQEHNPHELR
nr:BrnA antitoxin family protein [Halomonas elongata]